MTTQPSDEDILIQAARAERRQHRSGASMVGMLAVAVAFGVLGGLLMFLPHLVRMLLPWPFGILGGFSMPVFITPPGAKYKLDCAIARAAANTVNAVCENTGNAYAQLIEVVLSSQSGDKKLAGRYQPTYILPTIKRSLELKADAGRIPAGKAKLTVTLDDGSKQAFDVMLAE